MLRKLTLRSCNNLFSAHFETSNQYLQVIHLDDCGKIYDLSFRCPNLRVLLIERCSKAFCCIFHLLSFSGGEFVN
jgi:hypothetical protein